MTNQHPGSYAGSPTVVRLPPPQAGDAPPSRVHESDQMSVSALSGQFPSAVSTASTATPRGPNLDDASPRLSSQWRSDASSDRCAACQRRFDAIINRRHHCRLCGELFCGPCSDTRSLIPPSALVLRGERRPGSGPRATFSPGAGDDGDSTVTYVRSQNGLGGADDTLLYGRGLESRMLLARHPQRTCHRCRETLAPLQEELCLRNSNAMRFNYVDDANRLRSQLNSPVAFTLGHEVRKAAYALGNLLPGGGKTRGGTRGFVPSGGGIGESAYESDPCQGADAGCRAVEPNLRGLDNARIPGGLLARARGVAVVTVAKAGLGLAGLEFGTGLVVARTSDPGSGDPDGWSAPSAVCLAGFAWGALVGAQVADHVFLLMTDDAVRLFSSDAGRSVQLGADVAVSVGPVGRAAEADIGASAGSSLGLNGAGSDPGGGVAVAPVLSYSLSRGLYAGMSLDGRVLMTRDGINEKFYGRRLSGRELLSGRVPTPPAAQPLYDALKRCRVYGGGGRGGVGGDRAPLPDLPVASGRMRSAANPYNLSGREMEAGPDPGVGYY